MKNFLLILITLSVLISCNKKEEVQTESKEVNVYTHRHYESDKKLFKEFETKTGIKINVIKADGDQLIARIEQEGDNSPADLLLTVDAGNLWKAKEKGITQSISSEELNSNIPSHLRDDEGHWYGLTKRARFIVYSLDRVKKEELSTYEDLANPKWKGKILIRPSSNIYNQSLIASMIAHNGIENTKTFTEAFVKNFARKPAGSDRDQVKAVAAGEGDLAIVNSYYIAKMLNSDDELERNVAHKIGVFFPNQEDRGTHINISGGMILKNAPNKDNAIKLLEFLSSEKAQQEFANANYEYPVKEGINTLGILKEWGIFKEDTLPLSELGKNNIEAVKIFDIVDWN